MDKTTYRLRHALFVVSLLAFLVLMCPFACRKVHAEAKEISGLKVDGSLVLSQDDDLENTRKIREGTVIFPQEEMHLSVSDYDGYLLKDEKEVNVLGANWEKKESDGNWHTKNPGDSFTTGKWQFTLTFKLPEGYVMAEDAVVRLCLYSGDFEAKPDRYDNGVYVFSAPVFEVTPIKKGDRFHYKDFSFRVMDLKKRIVHASGYHGKEKNVTIPSPAVFKGKKYRVIGVDGYFSDSTEVSSVKVPRSVKNLQSECFAYSKNLEKVGLHSGITKIPRDCFRASHRLAKITGMSGVKYIGESSFAETGLKEFTCPAGVTALRNRSFAGCKKLRSFKLSIKTKSVHAGAFQRSAVSKFSVPKTNRYYKARTNLLLNKKGNRLVVFGAGKTPRTYTIPSGITAIGRYAFSGNRYLEKIVIKRNVQIIETSAFKNCDSLKSVSFGKRVRVIEKKAFLSNTPKSPMRSIKIPRNVIRISRYALGYYMTEDSENNIYYKKIPKFTIYGKAGSKAKAYAKSNGIRFKHY